MPERQNLKEYLEHPAFKLIGAVSDREGLETYVIGGFVRDKIMHRKRDRYDIDIVTIGSGIDLAQKVAAAINPRLKVSVFKNFGTAMFRHQDVEF